MRSTIRLSRRVAVAAALVLVLGAVAPAVRAVGPPAHPHLPATVPLVLAAEERASLAKLRALADLGNLDIELPDLPEIPPLPSLSPEGWIGIGLSCDNCSIQTGDSGGTPHWRFRKPPKVYSVEPESPAARAGLHKGDVLTHIDGVSLTTQDGGRRFGAVAPGDSVRWTFDRDGKPRTATLVAVENPDRDGRMGAEVRAALDKLRAEQAHLRDQRIRLRSTLRDRAGREDLELLERSLETTIETALENLERSLEDARRQGRSWGRTGSGRDDQVGPDVPSPPAAPAPPSGRSRRLRYEGSVGGSRIEVRGSSAVVVTEEPGGGDLLITTPEATIRIQKSR